MSAPVDGAANVMEPRFFDPSATAPTRTSAGGSGCPHEALARGEFEWLQLLTHPEIWVYPGDDDARDDAGDARRRARDGG